MARIRSIHPGLSSDEAFMSMSMAAKAAWPLMWTECDDQGVFEWKPVVLKARIFPADNLDFNTILAEYVSLDCVKIISVNGKNYGLVRNFRRYQRPKKPNKVHLLPSEHENYVGLASSSSPPVPHQFPTSTEKPPQMEDEGCIKEERDMSETSSDVPLPKSQKRNPKDYPEDFKAFFSAYPHDAGMSKPEALKAWRKLSFDERIKAVDAIPAFKGWVSAQGKDYRTVHACRYLSQKRFDGFVEFAKAVEKTNIATVPIFKGTPEFDAWSKFSGGKMPVFPIRGEGGRLLGEGCYKPTKFPPSIETVAA